MTQQESKERFYKAVSFIKREGINDLMTWLEQTDFFTAPASSKYHGNYEGGLVEHLINVLQFALHNFNYLVKVKPEYEYLRESVIISALFHDLCKVNFYVKKEKWKKDENNKWISYSGYEVKDTLAIGHGEKSMYLANKYISLTEAEAMAIRWHMSNTEVSVNMAGSPQAYSYNRAIDHPLVRLIMAADQLSLTVELINT